MVIYCPFALAAIRRLCSLGLSLPEELSLEVYGFRADLALEVWAMLLDVVGADVRGLGLARGFGQP